ncbi:MAG TPA: NADPH-dependent F420 reductase [Blastocatellia bacterium]
MKIAIIGSGNVGGSLGRVWAAKGHEIAFGARDPNSEKAKALASTTGAQVLNIADAARDAEVVVLATPWEATAQAIEQAGDLAGKIIIDCTNPLLSDLSGLSIGHTDSAGETVARLAKGARVVKAFNTTGAGNMLDPRYGDQAADMFICGDDEDAKRVVAGLAQEAGFEAVDAGPLSNARLLEPMAMLWIFLALKKGWGTNFAFKLLRR